MLPRYLTKSKFKLAIECPTKLFYAGKKEYANQKSDDAFLQALAEGGFQVGELAKCYYPEGITVHTLDPQQALQETQALLQHDHVIIFEAAILYKNLFLRADILIKNKNTIDLIEVKSSSIEDPYVNVFTTQKNTIATKWKPYLFDIAFQKYVLSKVYPNFQITSYLMLADKSAQCPTDGLNQKFRIKRDKKGKTKIIVSDKITAEDLHPKILCKRHVDEYVDLILKSEYEEAKSFSEYVDYLAWQYQQDIKIPPKLGAFCKKCEFKTAEKQANWKSGFKECWMQSAGFKEEDFAQPNVLDIWNSRKKDKWIHAGKFRMNQIEEKDIKPKSDTKAGWSQSQRQWLQVEKAIADDDEPELDHLNLKIEMDKWQYPLHFIDFETTMVAIPFHKGARPYQGIAFQFSHHVLHANGKVEHAGEFLNQVVGKNPNLDFIRALKANLEHDQGTIFRYSHHENSFLNAIYEEIKNSALVIPDYDELLSFIKTISKSTEKKKESWIGGRQMVDLCELTQRFYYDPQTNGSNSIKKVFPAILNRSSYLQEKYSQPIYGTKNGIKSLNFRNKQWIKKEHGKVIDPYLSLPKLFQDLNIADEEIELLFGDEGINQGGAASIAYARMQFTEMSDIERRELTQALLKYCELDTLAMVMIVEAWREMM